MPRYHFHLENSDQVIGDVEGSEFADDNAAVREAGRAATEVVMDELTSGRLTSKVVVWLERRDRTKIAVINVNATVEVADTAS